MRLWPKSMKDFAGEMANAGIELATGNSTKKSKPKKSAKKSGTGKSNRKK